MYPHSCFQLWPSPTLLSMAALPEWSSSSEAFSMDSTGCSTSNSSLQGKIFIPCMSQLDNCYTTCT